MFQKTGIFFIKITNVPVCQFILCPKYFSNETSLTHLIKLANYMSFILQLSFIPSLNFINECRSNLDFLLYHPLGTFLLCHAFFMQSHNLNNFSVMGREGDSTVPFLMQNFCKTLWIFENFNIFCIFSFSDPTACYHHGSG